MSRAHGKYASYIKGCRCDDCREAHTEYHRQRRAKKREAQALNAPLRSAYGLPTIDEGDVSWRVDAACRDVDPSVFFPARGSGHFINWAPAMKVCARCPVKDACLDYALRTNQPDGAWGGTTPSQRRTMRRNPTTLNCRDCRAEFPYARNRKLCDECREADRKAKRKEYSRQQYLRNVGRVAS